MTTTHRIRPVGQLARHDKRELLRLRDRYERLGHLEDLRAALRLQLPDMSRPQLAALTRAELLALMDLCDQETLRDAQQAIAASSAAAERGGDDDARQRAERARGTLAYATALLESQLAQ